METVVDFNGGIFKSRPFDVAHKKWFAVMANLLNDESINEFAGMGDYFPKVHEVMKQFLGNVSEEVQNKFARELYAMTLIAEITKDDVNQKVVEKIQNQNPILITSAPSSAVEPMLEKTGLDNLFKEIHKSPVNEQPNKIKLFEKFLKTHEVKYLGKRDKDFEKLQEMGVSCEEL